MEAKVVQSFQFSTWMMNSERLVRMPNNYSLHIKPRFREKHMHQQLRIAGNQKRRAVLMVACSSPNYQAQVLESEPALFDEVLTFKKKAEEVEPYLYGRCIYLVGMMGSGKTTVGNVLSKALGYSFYDCDKLIEQAAGGITVAEIFKLHGESFFRDNETEVLRELSLMHRVIVSTGGGAVVRPINWEHMRKGISVFLDVPLEALARRITKDGTQSRPLLYDESGDAYEQTLSKLISLWEARGEAYLGADAKVSLENIAAKLGYKDVCKISPIVIATEDTLAAYFLADLGNLIIHLARLLSKLNTS